VRFGAGAFPLAAVKNARVEVCYSNSRLKWNIVLCAACRQSRIRADVCIHTLRQTDELSDFELHDARKNVRFENSDARAVPF